MSGTTSTRKVVPAIHAAFPVLRISFFAMAAASRPCAATCDREMAARMPSPSPPPTPRFPRADDEDGIFFFWAGWNRSRV
uniref:Uncharacterized protein n=1 Tax=Arundo donax TaxID=35708 RepID=A0A0A9EVX5_ARUDO